MESTEQTVEDTVSVEDKIANHFFGPEEQPQEAAEQESDEVQAEADESEEPVSEESDVVEVEFNGKSYQVPTELKDALMREIDYTKKTQSLSSQRKELELQQKQVLLAREQEAFNQSVKEEVGQLEMLDNYIKYVNQNTNWASLDEKQGFATFMELSKLKEQREELQKSLSSKYQQFQGQIDKRRKDLSAEADKVLSTSIPNWSEKTKGEVRSYVMSLGYPEIGADNMSSLDYQVAYKAMQFDQLKSKTTDAVKKASAAPAIKPTARREMPSDVQKKLNYRNKLKTTKDPRQRQQLAEERIADIFTR